VSTHYIKTLMNMTGCSGAENCIHCKVRGEVEAIEKSCLVLYQQGVVHPEMADDDEASPELDAAADYLMTIGMEQMP
jgi:hypothetical protein